MNTEQTENSPQVRRGRKQIELNLFKILQIRERPARFDPHAPEIATHVEFQGLIVGSGEGARQVDVALAFRLETQCLQQVIDFRAARNKAQFRPPEICEVVDPALACELEGIQLSLDVVADIGTGEQLLPTTRLAL